MFLIRDRPMWSWLFWSTIGLAARAPAGRTAEALTFIFCESECKKENTRQVLLCSKYMIFNFFQHSPRFKLLRNYIFLSTRKVMETFYVDIYLNFSIAYNNHRDFIRYEFYGIISSYYIIKWKRVINILSTPVRTSGTTQDPVEP